MVDLSIVFCMFTRNIAIKEVSWIFFTMTVVLVQWGSNWSLSIKTRSSCDEKSRKEWVAFCDAMLSKVSVFWPYFHGQDGLKSSLKSIEIRHFSPRASERRVLLMVGVVKHFHIFTSSHPHIFTFSLALLLSCPLALLPSCSLALSLSPSFLFLSWRRGAVPTRRHETQPFRTKRGSIPQNWSKIAILQPRRQPFRTKWGSIAKHWGNIAILSVPRQRFRNLVAGGTQFSGQHHGHHAHHGLRMASINATRCTKSLGASVARPGFWWHRCGMWWTCKFWRRKARAGGWGLGFPVGWEWNDGFVANPTEDGGND